MPKFTNETLLSITGNAPNNIFCSSKKGSIFHYNGESWAKMTTHIKRPINGFWHVGKDKIMALGDDTILFLGKGYKKLNPIGKIRKQKTHLSFLSALKLFRSSNFGYWDPSEFNQLSEKNNLIYATGAKASSWYGSSRSWSALQATGAPNVFPKYADDAKAWAPKNAKSRGDWLEVTFPETTAKFVYIFETNRAGTITKVVNLTDKKTTIYENKSFTPYKKAQVLWIKLLKSNKVSRLRIYINPSLTSNWPEIDAVALVVK